MSQAELGYRGGCACGALRYRLNVEATQCCYCHCESCRNATGAVFVAWATFPTVAFELTGSGLRIRRSSKHAKRGFCGACGTQMTYAHDKRPGEFDLAVATLDNPDSLPPQFHIWVSEKPSWAVIGDELPQYSGWKRDG